MKLVRYGIAAGLLFSVGACANMMGGGAAPQSTAVVAPPAVAPDMVRQVQSKLRDGGYYKQGPVDGVWGSGTQASVRAFQRDHNLTANGELDMPTLQALNLTSDSAPNTTRNDVNSTRADVPPTQPNYNPPPPVNSTAPAPQR